MLNSVRAIKVAPKKKWILKSKQKRFKRIKIALVASLHEQKKNNKIFF